MANLDGTGKITVDFGNLFILVNGTSLPITAIKVMTSGWGGVELHLKEEYCYGGKSYILIGNMSLEQIQDTINQTIINALKESIK